MMFSFFISTSSVVDVAGGGDSGGGYGGVVDLSGSSFNVDEGIYINKYNL